MLVEFYSTCLLNAVVQGENELTPLGSIRLDLCEVEPYKGESVSRSTCLGAGKFVTTNRCGRLGIHADGWEEEKSQDLLVRFPRCVVVDVLRMSCARTQLCVCS